MGSRAPLRPLPTAFGLSCLCAPQEARSRVTNAPLAGTESSEERELRLKCEDAGVQYLPPGAKPYELELSSVTEQTRKEKKKNRVRALEQAVKRKTTTVSELSGPSARAARLRPRSSSAPAALGAPPRSTVARGEAQGARREGQGARINRG